MDRTEVIELAIEKPAAGGRMIARHEGRVVLVSGAIPGERVRARLEAVRRGVVYADVLEVLDPSPDRRPAGGDWRCGGNAFAHIQYPRQLSLKAAIIGDAFARLARIHGVAASVVASPEERGYRMRARLHAADGRIGFFREGTHDLCDAAATGQLLPAAGAWIRNAEDALARGGCRGLLAVELADDLPGRARAAHLELEADADPRCFSDLAAGLSGLSAARRGSTVERLAGTTTLVDVLHVREGDPGSALRLRRDVRAFFQANRYLLEPLVRHVVGLVPGGPVVDLYAGVGLFGLSVAASGQGPVTLVESDPVSGADLEGNAEAFPGRVRVERRSVEAYLAAVGRRAPNALREATVIVDPPRTGLSRMAAARLIEAGPARLVYVSCDVPTLARDSRRLVDAGYALSSVTGLDLFPNTAHVETIASFVRAG